MDITTPLTKETTDRLKAGDAVYITGYIYTARDAAHKKMLEEIDNGGKLPFDITDQIIYYVGPCPSKPNKIIGSCGPTTSGRMDVYAPKLLNIGLRGMIGKGERTQGVYDAMIANGGVYFGATGGAGALLAKCVKSIEEIAYPELMSESIKRLYVERFPVIVIADTFGNNLYKLGPAKFKKS